MYVSGSVFKIKIESKENNIKYHININRECVMPRDDSNVSYLRIKNKHGSKNNQVKERSTATMVQQKGVVLQEPYLNVLRKEKIPVSVFLVNGIKLQGTVESFDQFVIMLRSAVNQMVYKHAISTIVPAKAVKVSSNDGYDAE